MCWRAVLQYDIHVYVCMHVCMYMYVCVYMYVCMMGMCAARDSQIHSLTYMDTHIYIYIYIYI